MIEKIISENENSIRDLIYHIHLLNQEEYNSKTENFSHSSFGEHIRHIFNFYECILNGIQTGIIDYDNRIRDKKIESDQKYAILRFQEILEILPNLKNFESKKMILITDEIQTETTLLRELIYVNEHLIHHSAILRIYFQFYFSEKIISKSFGFAKSTQNHQENLKILSLK